MNENRIYLVRHGENYANISKEFSYKKVDYDLTEKGHLQAEQTACHFKHIKIDAIYSSPLKRAIQTAEYISRSKAIDMEVIEEFREIDVGDLELMKPDRYNWEIYLKIIQEWYSGNKKAQFPNGENYHELLTRFYNGLRLVTRNRANQDIVIVGHVGIFTTGIYELCEIKNRKYLLNKENVNCSISILKLETEEDNLTTELMQWAESSHLHGEAALFVKGLPEK